MLEAAFAILVTACCPALRCCLALHRKDVIGVEAESVEAEPVEAEAVEAETVEVEAVEVEAVEIGKGLRLKAEAPNPSPGLQLARLLEHLEERLSSEVHFGFGQRAHFCGP